MQTKPNIWCQCSTCYTTINTSASHVRLEDRYFCNTECVMEHIQQESRLENACDNFSPRIHTEKKWWGSNQPMAGNTNPEDM